MGDTLDSKKVRLVNKITAVQDEALLDWLEKVLEAAAAVNPEIWAKVLKPVRQRQTVEDMIREQNFQGINRAKFDAIINELDIQDPHGELLKSLTK